jgi:hypothetical protein
VTVRVRKEAAGQPGAQFSALASQCHPGKARQVWRAGARVQHSPSEKPVAPEQEHSRAVWVRKVLLKAHSHPSGPALSLSWASTSQACKGQIQPGHSKRMSAMEMLTPAGERCFEKPCRAQAVQFSGGSQEAPGARIILTMLKTVISCPYLNR